MAIKRQKNNWCLKTDQRKRKKIHNQLRGNWYRKRERTSNIRKDNKQQRRFGQKSRTSVAIPFHLPTRYESLSHKLTGPNLYCLPHRAASMFPVSSATRALMRATRDSIAKMICQSGSMFTMLEWQVLSLTLFSTGVTIVRPFRLAGSAGRLIESSSSFRSGLTNLRPAVMRRHGA